LAQQLLDALKDPKIKYVRVPGAMPGGKEGVGINSGQLYYLIRDIKTEADTQPENRLKKELLERILGETAVREARHGGKDYYCAALGDWGASAGLHAESQGSVVIIQALARQKSMTTSVGNGITSLCRGPAE
jgi:hypothetical protein